MKINASKGVCNGRYSCKNLNTDKCKPLTDSDEVECNHYERSDGEDKTINNK